MQISFASILKNQSEVVQAGGPIQPPLRRGLVFTPCATL